MDWKVARRLRHEGIKIAAEMGQWDYVGDTRHWSYRIYNGLLFVS